METKHEVITDRKLEECGEALRGPDGSVVAIQGIVQDIDNRKRAEEAQHKSAEEFKAAFEDAPFGMCLSSLDNQFLRVNQAFCQLLGYSKEELLAGGWQGLTHPDDLERSRGAVDELRSGRAASVEFEKRYIHKQGNVIWVRMRISVVRDGRGEPSYFITHVQDITERVKAEERMQLWSRGSGSKRRRYHHMRPAGANSARQQSFREVDRILGGRSAR